MNSYSQDPKIQNSLICAAKSSTKWWSVVHFIVGFILVIAVFGSTYDKSGLILTVLFIILHIASYVGVCVRFEPDEDDKPKRVKDKAYRRLQKIRNYIIVELAVELLACFYMVFIGDMFKGRYVFFAVILLVHCVLDALFLKAVPFQHLQERNRITSTVKTSVPEKIMVLHDLAGCERSFISQCEDSGYILLEYNQLEEMVGNSRAKKIQKECRVEVFIIDKAEQMVQQMDAILKSDDGFLKRYVFLGISNFNSMQATREKYGYYEYVYYKREEHLTDINAGEVADIFMNAGKGQAGTLIGDTQRKARERVAVRNSFGDTMHLIYTIAYKLSWCINICFILFLIYAMQALKPFTLFADYSAYHFCTWSFWILVITWCVGKIIRKNTKYKRFDWINKLGFFAVAYLFSKFIENGSLQLAYYSLKGVRNLENAKVVYWAFVYNCVILGFLYRSKEKDLDIQQKKNEKREKQIEKEAQHIIENEVEDSSMLLALSGAYDDPIQYCDLIKRHCNLSPPQKYHYEKLRTFLMNALLFRNISRSTMALLDYIEMSLRLVHYYVLLKKDGEQAETSYDTISVTLNEMAANIYLNSDVLTIKNRIKLNVLEKSILKQLAEKTDLIIEDDEMDFNGFVYLVKVLRDKVIAHGVLRENNVLQIWTFFVYASILLTKYLKMEDFVVETDGDKVQIGYKDDGKLLDAGRFVLVREGELYIACLVPREKKNLHRITYSNYFSGDLIIPNYVED